MVRRSPRRALAAIALVSAFARSAHAAPTAEDRAAASATFREAQDAFARRDYAAAAAAFEQSALRAPHPTTWLNAAQAWEKREEWARAADDCDRALELPNIDPAVRREAEVRLRAVLPHVATLDVIGARGSGVRIDDEALQPLPVKRRLRPGTHQLVVVDLATSHESPATVTIDPGQAQTFDASSLAPPPAAPAAAPPPAPTVPTRPPDRASKPGIASWVAWAAGGALGIGSGVFGAITVGDKHDYDAAPTSSSYDRFYRDRLITNVAFGGAVVALAAGFLFWAIAPSHGDSTPPRHLEF